MEEKVKKVVRGVMGRPKKVVEEELPEDMKVCNCAGCGNLCSSDKRAGGSGMPRMLEGRVRDRPYCPTCFRLATEVDTMAFAYKRDRALGLVI